MQRSNIRSFSVTFNEPVNLAVASFTLYKATLVNGAATAYTNDVSTGVTFTSTRQHHLDIYRGFGRNSSAATVRRSSSSMASTAWCFMRAAVTDHATGLAKLGSGDQIVPFNTTETNNVSGTAPAFHVLYGDLDGNGILNNQT